MDSNNRLALATQQLLLYKQELLRELERTTKALEALSSTSDAASLEDDDGQSMTDAVLNIFRSRPGEFLTIKQVFEEIQSRGGWSSDSKDPINVVRSALARLAQNDELVRAEERRGAYTLAPSAQLKLTDEASEARERYEEFKKRKAARMREDLERRRHARAESSTRTPDGSRGEDEEPKALRRMRRTSEPGSGD